jgi:hypothetical protein
MVGRRNRNPALQQFYSNPEIGRVAACQGQRDIEWGSRTVMTPQGEQPIGGPAKDIHNARNIMAA